MIYKLTLGGILIFALIYTLSYAVFEYRNKNTPAAAGVCVLCFISVVVAFFYLR